MSELPQDVQSLINIYTKAKQELIDAIAKKEAVGTLTWYQKSLLSQVNEQLKTLDKQAKDWTNKAIPENYQKGINEVNSALEGVGINVSTSATFAGLHTDAVKVISANAYSDLANANMFVGRTIQDAVRQAGIDAVGQKIAQGQTVKQCKQLLLNNLIDQGLNGIKDKRGRMISIDSYASMVARSTTREATNKATLNQLTGLGYDLVKMSSHATTCSVCAALQGRVYSISGNDKRYPRLSIAYSGVHANIHPNCRHVLTPYIEALATDEEADREFSNRPFDIDPRSQAEIDRYNQEQAKRRKLRNDRSEFEKYKLALPDTAPKSFSGFQAMKRADSVKYQDLAEEYKKVNIIQNKVKEGSADQKNIIPWPENFPKIINHTSVTNLKSKTNGNYELHVLAKRGDEVAADELVRKVMKPEKVQDLYNQTKDIPNKIITPVIALEKVGYNKIPEKYAAILENIIGINATNSIVQINKSFHTGENAIGRIVSRAEFDGEVKKGYNYIIVDDVVTLGGTLSDLRKYIVGKEGNVILASTVAQRGYLDLAVTTDLINQIIKRFGRDEIEKYFRQFGIANGLEELTYGEAISILRFKQINTLRNRTIEERSKRNI